MEPEMIDRLISNAGGIRGLEAPPEGWLKTVRQAVGFTQADMAEYLQVCSQTISAYERNESTGALTLRALKTYATALGCDVVYCLVPKSSVIPNFTEYNRAVAKIKRKQPATPAAPPAAGLDDLKTKAWNAFFKATDSPTAPDLESPDELTRRVKSFGKEPPKS